ncbi:uncharacterized protein LOC110036910, partial [Phalaenopsis equestris]|uniref:uncharacterized protein LOC110036910 n=1 Tax=Phalaenopsis equestris TaxID=78828 RepID=UPI0009E1C297
MDSNIGEVVINCLAYIRKLIQWKNFPNILQISRTEVQKEYKIIKVIWEKPKHPFIKLNIDGSFSSNKVGIGGVFSDQQSKCILYFKSLIKAEDSIEAKTVALYWALKMTVMNKWTHLQAEVDSSQLVNYMTGSSTPPWHIQQWIIIMQQLCKEIKLRFSFIYKEGNRPANFLATDGADSQMITVSTTPPSPLDCLLKGDK